MPLITDANRKWWTLIATGLALFTVNVDYWGVAVLLPEIGKQFGAPTEQLEWVVNAFILLFASPVIAVGRLGDIIGRRKILLAGLAIYALASLGCALAGGIGWLIFWRSIQGLGSALYFASSLAIVSNVFPAKQRGMGIGLWTAIGLTGAASGPVIAGVLTGVFGWQVLFYFSGGVAVPAIALTLFAVRETRDDKADRRVDWAGFVTVTLAVVLLVFGIERSTALGWGSPVVLGSLAGSALVMVLFVRIERAIAYPLIELNLFRDRDYVLATAIGTATNYIIAAVIFFMTLYLQRVRAMSAIETGLMYLFLSVPFVAISPVAGRMTDRLGPRLPLFLSLIAYAAGLVALALIAVDSGLWLIGIGMLLVGTGMALAFNVSTVVAMLALPESKAGAAGGVLMTIRHVGNGLGVAVTGVIFNALAQAKLADLLQARGADVSPGQLPELRGLLAGSSAARDRLAAMSTEIQDHVDAITHAAFVDGFAGAMLACLPLCVICFVLVFWIRPAAKETP